MNEPPSETPPADLIPLRVYLQVEGLVSLAAATSGYAYFSFSWWLYAVLFFAPDLSMLGYLINRRMGALFYNIGHTYTAPILLLLASYLAHASILCGMGLIWWAHIGFDRLLGYGLKHDSGFKNTHLDHL